MEKTDFIEMMKKRTKGFFLEGIIIADLLPKNRLGWMLEDQFLRSSSSVGANYRAVCRARSNKEFFSKVSIVIEELDESLYWLEIMVEPGTIKREKVIPLYKEGTELISILSTSRKNISQKLKKAS